MTASEGDTSDLAALEVLLFSPVRGVDPDGGDIAYTEALLAAPPPGVRYTTYRDALADGRVIVRGKRPRTLRELSFVDLGILTFRFLERLLRGRLIYREPIWFVTIDPSFALVHQHLFAVRQVSSAVPAISSAGYPLREHYRLRDEWSRTRLATAEMWRQASARLLRVHIPGTWCPTGDLLTVYTSQFQKWVGRRLQPSRVFVLPQYLPGHADDGMAHEVGQVVAFVGNDFIRKGGDVALQAFTTLLGERTDLRVEIISDDPAAHSAVAGTGVVCRPAVARDDFVRSILPQLRVMVLPTRGDCGVPVTVLEALRAGVQVVLSDCEWLDERLQGDCVWRTPIEVASVTRAVREAVKLQGLAHRRRAGIDLFNRHFSAFAVAPRYRSAYERVLDPSDPVGPNAVGER